MTFEQYLKEQGIKLFSWQTEAATAFLYFMYYQRSGTTGKTFLIQKLNEFLCHHGNDFEM